MKVYKYKIERLKKTTLRLPTFFTLLSAGIDQYGNLCVWAEVDENGTVEDMTIACIGTGMDVLDDAPYFISTVFEMPFVWHVYYGRHEK